MIGGRAPCKAPDCEEVVDNGGGTSIIGINVSVSGGGGNLDMELFKRKRREGLVLRRPEDCRRLGGGRSFLNGPGASSCPERFLL